MASGPARQLLHLFYDDDCELCCRLQRLVQAWDPSGQVEAVALSAPDLDARFPDLDVARARQNLTARAADGTLYEDLAALRQVAVRIPRLRRLGWIYRLPGVHGVARGAYRSLNRYRRQLCRECGERRTRSRRRGQKPPRG